MSAPSQLSAHINRSSIAAEAASGTLESQETNRGESEAAFFPPSGCAGLQFGDAQEENSLYINPKCCNSVMMIN